MGVHRPPTTSGGGGGGGGTVTRYTQTFSGTSLVTVTHGLGYPPDINVHDTAGNRIVAAITHVSVNVFTVAFNFPLTGVVYYT